MNENKRTALVLGATGGIGSAVAQALVAHGWAVRGMARDPDKAVAEALSGLPAHKMHCSVLAEEAIKNALKDYFDKNNIPYNPADFPELDHDELHDAVHGEE